MHAHWRDNVISASKVTEEEPLRELLLPRDAPTRLCFFSIAVDRLSLYRSEVFPYVQALGFVPVTADDVISPGDNINAKIDALIDRSAVMVVEPTTQSTIAELRMALTRRSRASGKDPRAALRTIVVQPDVAGRHMDIAGAQYFPIPKGPLGDIESFVSDLTQLLATFAGELGLGLDTEPARLLSQNEPRAAVISAMTLLETRLRERLNDPTLSMTMSSLHASNKFRVESLRSMLDAATALGLIPAQDRKKLDGWMRLRNEVVHGSKPVTAQKAREIVVGVGVIVEMLRGESGTTQ